MALVCPILAAALRFFPSGAGRFRAVPGLCEHGGHVEPAFAAVGAGNHVQKLAIAGHQRLGGRFQAVGLEQGGGTEPHPLQCDATFDAVSERGGERMTLNSFKVALPSGTFVLSGSLDRSAGGKLADIT